MTRAASERVEQIPAKYETVQERVMQVTPASKKIEQVPAEYKTVQEQVLVETGSYRMETRKWSRRKNGCGDREDYVPRRSAGSV